jgi:hypothetical protein
VPVNFDQIRRKPDSDFFSSADHLLTKEAVALMVDSGKEHISKNKFKSSKMLLFFRELFEAKLF